jgi:hypothetical protein
MRILLWHVHGSWTTSFVQGKHTYLVPVLPGRPPDGLGRARTWAWPAGVEEVTPAQARSSDVDVVLLQRPRELAHLVRDWTGRHPGVDLPAIYVEHNAPDATAWGSLHPAGASRGVVVAHVTHFNRLMWDCQSAASVVIEHGVVDPGYRYSGVMSEAVFVANEAPRRGRVVGTDLLLEMRTRTPIAVFGMGAEPIGGRELAQDRLHDEMALRRAYLHPVRWTSLGLTLIEAMQLGMPVVALGTTEVAEAVPPGAGVVSLRPERLLGALQRLAADPEEAAVMGKVARAGAIERFGLARFLADWDSLLSEVLR